MPGLFDDLNPYEPVQVPGDFGAKSQAMVDRNAQASLQSPEELTARLNRDVAEKSNLFGPKAPDGSESSALSARGRQLYGTAVNQMMRDTTPYAQNRLLQMQQKSINEQAAQYSNMQSAAQLNYQQISFQRAAAIQQEVNKRNLLASLFGGIASAGGMALAHINAGMQTPNEVPDPNAGRFNYKPGSMSPDSYQSKYFGTIGGSAPSSPMPMTGPRLTNQPLKF